MVPRLFQMRNLTIFGLDNIGQIKPGDDVAELIFEKSREGSISISDGDLIVISQKIVSKADGLLVDVTGIRPSSRAKRLANVTKKDARVAELIEPIVDYRGLEDMYGYSLRYKYVALADEAAAAGELVMGQGTERTPVAIIRGLERMKRTLNSNLSRELLMGRRLDVLR